MTAWPVSGLSATGRAGDYVPMQSCCVCLSRLSVIKNYFVAESSCILYTGNDKLLSIGADSIQLIVNYGR